MATDKENLDPLIGSVVILFFINGQTVMGKLIDIHEAAVILEKPVTFQQMMTQQGPTAVPIPYGAPFIVDSFDDNVQRKFFKSHLITPLAKATSAMSDKWFNMTSVIKKAAGVNPSLIVAK